MTASAWTEDRVGRLKTLWHEGQTAEQIARDLANGITRCAVLGKVYRMGLSAGRPERPVARTGRVGERGRPHGAPVRLVSDLPCASPRFTRGTSIGRYLRGPGTPPRPLQRVFLQ